MRPPRRGPNHLSDAMREDEPDAEDAKGPAWGDLRVFLHVARAGTLSGAARTLAVSQTTVARRLEALEATLGPLTERRGRGVVLTPLGETVRPHAEAAEASIHAVARCAREPAREELHLGTTLGLATHVVVPLLPELRRAAPTVRVSVQTGLRKDDVMRREADLVLRMGGPGDERLVGRRVAVVGAGLYASEDYLARRGMPADAEALRDHALVGARGALARVPQERALRALTGDAEPAWATDDATAKVAAVASGLGIGTLCGFMAPRGLRRVLPEAFDVAIDLWLLMRPDLRKRAPVRAFLKVLGEALDAERPRLRAAP